MRDNKRGTIEDRAYVAAVLGEQPSVRADVFDAAYAEPQSPQEASLDEALDFAAYRCFETLLVHLTPLVEAGRANAVDILGIVTILRDEYQERYEAYRGN